VESFEDVVVGLAEIDVVDKSWSRRKTLKTLSKFSILLAARLEETQPIPSH
jgi:hypothetical protein